MPEESHTEVVITPKGRSDKIHSPDIPAYTLKEAYEDIESRKYCNRGKINLFGEDIECSLYNKRWKDIQYIHNNEGEGAYNKVSFIFFYESSIDKILFPKFP